MAGTFSNMLNKAAAAKQAASDAYANSGDVQKAVMNAAVLALTLMPELAFAQSGAGGGGIFCFIAQYFKQIAGGAALVVICLWAIEHFFGVSKIHDMVIKVGIGAAVIVGASAFVANSGLSSNCVL